MGTLMKMLRAGVRACDQEDPTLMVPMASKSMTGTFLGCWFCDLCWCAHSVLFYLDFRAWRARRRHQVSDDDMDLDDDDDLDGAGGPSPGNWIDWSLVKGGPRCLSTVCLALVNRLLKEEASVSGFDSHARFEFAIYLLTVIELLDHRIYSLALWTPSSMVARTICL